MKVGGYNKLWKSDGTAVGTVAVSGLAVDANGNLPFGLTSTGNQLFFVAFDDQHGTELWSSGGTAAGTRLVRDIAPGPEGSNPSELTNINGTLFFAASDSRATSPGTATARRRERRWCRTSRRSVPTPAASQALTGSCSSAQATTP